MSCFFAETFCENPKMDIYFCPFSKFFKKFVQKSEFVTDSSQNLSNTKEFCDHKKNFEKIQF